MTDAAPPAIDRIYNALARIEHAAAQRAFDTERLQQRHAKLRGRVEEALEALETLIDQGTAPETSATSDKDTD